MGRRDPSGGLADGALVGEAGGPGPGQRVLGGRELVGGGLGERVELGEPRGGTLHEQPGLVGQLLHAGLVALESHPGGGGPAHDLGVASCDLREGLPGAQRAEDLVGSLRERDLDGPGAAGHVEAACQRADPFLPERSRPLLCGDVPS